MVPHNEITVKWYTYEFYCETIKYTYRECASDLDHMIQVGKTRPSIGCTVVVKEVGMNKKKGGGKMEGGRVETIMTIVKRNVEQITGRAVMHPLQSGEAKCIAAREKHSGRAFFMWARNRFSRFKTRPSADNFRRARCSVSTSRRVVHLKTSRQPKITRGKA